MNAISERIDGGRAAALSIRYAFRELRGGLRGFYVFIACIALGVMAIAGVGSLAASLNAGLAREGRTLLGGDVSFVLFQREAKPDEVAFLGSHGGCLRCKPAGMWGAAEQDASSPRRLGQGRDRNFAFYRAASA